MTTPDANGDFPEVSSLPASLATGPGGQPTQLKTPQLESMPLYATETSPSLP